MAQKLLHGVLHAKIFELDRPASQGCCIYSTELLDKFQKTLCYGQRTSKLYATIHLDNTKVGRTILLETKNNGTSNPKWNESFHIYCAHSASNVIFSIKEHNPIGPKKVIGRAFVPAEEILSGKQVEKWPVLLDTKHQKPLPGGPKIHVKLRFSHVNADPNWSKGIQNPNFPGVPYTFFTQRVGCRVTLYQDAHVEDKFAPEIPLLKGQKYEPNRCWEDIFDAISNAKHLVYIAGWSVTANITLVRDQRRVKPQEAGEMTLGELLKKKAREGVKVLMLVWDDRTSVKLLKNDGVMATGDEDTESYFNGTGVQCVLCPRNNPDRSAKAVGGLLFSTMFTHHQKIVVVDIENVPNAHGDTTGKRRIVSFIGGIDLCDGRYDTPSHPIFKTLHSVHRSDFYQPCFPDSSIRKGGPREPWHDIHCRLEGEVVWDVLSNFEQRWRKQGVKEDSLVPLSKFDNIFVPPSLEVNLHQDHETWNVQLFRSIDGGAANFDSPDRDRAGLVSGKDHFIERSIQDAYINAIRRAKNFIYIENQYFLGSSFSWYSNGGHYKQKVGALHLIPKELSLKIVSKIEAGERFAVYIVIPMWPEGTPESGSVQAILYWQKMTMEMMYKDIVQALKSKGIEADPKDYLTFFCLGNRESKNSLEYEPPEQPDEDTDYRRAQKSRRFMIYVHSKMMIVDDEYIIVGSANINQRSMDGARDTEIAIGAYQPHHLAKLEPAKGQIHGHRMALWYEHMGKLDDAFLRPESAECIQKVNHIAQHYWNLYSLDASEQDHCFPGHLLSYPIRVLDNGEVTSLPEAEFFPDTNARVLGSKFDLLPSILTT